MDKLKNLCGNFLGAFLKMEKALVRSSFFDTCKVLFSFEDPVTLIKTSLNS